MAKRVLKKKARKVRELITEGKELHSHMKDLSARLEDIKVLLRQHAAATDNGFIKGYNRSVVLIEDVDSFQLDVRKFKANVRPKEFLDAVSVKIGAARDLLTDAKFEQLAKKSTNKWSRVTFTSVDEVE